MMDIHDHLKALRRARGLTQEAVARQMGLTRQAVSSHESGRTQPDLEMLTRYGEIYGVSLQEILYGSDHSERQFRRQFRRLFRRLRRAAWMSGALLLVCNAVWAGLRWTGSRFFPVEEGRIQEAMNLDWERHRLLMDLSEKAEGLSLMIAWLAAVALVVMALRMEQPVPLRRKLKYLSAMAVLVPAAVLPFALTDPVFGLADYTVTPLRQILWAVMANLVLVVADALRKRKST